MKESQKNACRKTGFISCLVSWAKSPAGFLKLCSRKWEQGAKMSQALQKPHLYKWGDLCLAPPYSSLEAMEKLFG